MTMRTSQNFSAHLRSLRDDPQSVARSIAASGERVVGYVGNDVPVALILAANAVPVRLRCNPQASPSHADLFVESSFSPELRIIASQWVQGALDHLHSVVFARSDDSGQRLYYYLCELQRRGLCAGPRPLLFDVAGLARNASFEHTLESTRTLASQLGVAADAVARSRGRVAQREDLLSAVRVQRLLSAPLAGSAARAIEYAAACDWRTSFDEAARDWLTTAVPLSAPKRVLLAGDPVPDDQLHTAIEAGGGTVVAELTESTGTGRRQGGDPLVGIAEEFQERESPALSMRKNAHWISEYAVSHRADAVVVWLSEQNEALPWEIARQMESLRAGGIRALLLARQPWHIAPAVLNRITEFCR
jgi:hypothetical protein